jgi:hypothetical protein
VTLAPPADGDHASAFLNIRVADIAAAYAEWSARGAEFRTRAQGPWPRDPGLHPRPRRSSDRGRPDGITARHAIGRRPRWRGALSNQGTPTAAGPRPQDSPWPASRPTFGVHQSLVPALLRHGRCRRWWDASQGRARPAGRAAGC